MDLTSRAISAISVQLPELRVRAEDYVHYEYKPQPATPPASLALYCVVSDWPVEEAVSSPYRSMKMALLDLISGGISHRCVSDPCIPEATSQHRVCGMHESLLFT